MRPRLLRSGNKELWPWERDCEIFRVGAGLGQYQGYKFKFLAEFCGISDYI